MIFDEVVEPEVRAKVGVTSGGTETILLVEDSDSFRDLAREILEEHGYQVIEASSGRRPSKRGSGIPGHAARWTRAA